MQQLAMNTRSQQQTTPLIPQRFVLFRTQSMTTHRKIVVLTQQTLLIYARRFPPTSTASLLTTFLSNPISMLLYTPFPLRITGVIFYSKQDVIVRP